MRSVSKIQRMNDLVNDLKNIDTNGVNFMRECAFVINGFELSVNNLSKAAYYAENMIKSNVDECERELIESLVKMRYDALMKSAEKIQFMCDFEDTYGSTFISNCKKAMAILLDSSFDDHFIIDNPFPGDDVFLGFDNPFGK